MPRPLVMGVLNVTPDSFSDGGEYLDQDKAMAHAIEMIDAGADVIDVGGESSRPGAEPVSERAELDRVIPVIEELAGRVRVSVDTKKPAVANGAIDAGATLLNDISASMWQLAADRGCGWVAMHMQGTPKTMQVAPSYADVVGEVYGFLTERAAMAKAAGVKEVWVDPGIGFGKKPEHNLALLRHLPELAEGGFPVLVGSSRKTFLGLIAPAQDGSAAPVSERSEATLATATWAMLAGAAMIRVHDVKAAAQAACLVGATRIAGSGRHDFQFQTDPGGNR
jgi:dihydropteroate synthase